MHGLTFGIAVSSLSVTLIYTPNFLIQIREREQYGGGDTETPDV